MAETLDFKWIQGIKCLLEEPRKVSQNTAIQWYKVVRKVVRLSNKHLLIQSKIILNRFNVSMQYNISFSTLIFSYQVTRGEQVPMKCPKIKKSLLELLAQQTVTHFSLKIRKFIGSAVSPRNSRGKKRTTGIFSNRS